MECLSRWSCWKIVMAQTLTTYDPDGWRERAACRNMDTAVFFPESDEETAVAKAVCAACPVRGACLDFALLTRQDDGVWGGLDENERRRVRRRRQDAARKAA
jgi:WhiB family redox-sensing transcriptional regulator